MGVGLMDDRVGDSQAAWAWSTNLSWRDFAVDDARHTVWIEPRAWGPKQSERAESR